MQPVTVTRVSVLHYPAGVYVTAHLDDYVSITTHTERGEPQELREAAAEVDRKIARLQRQADMLRQAANLLEAKL